ARTVLVEDLFDALDADSFAPKGSSVTENAATYEGLATTSDGATYGSAKATYGGPIYQAQPGDIAFIQFSSGSTGDPKGVVITHRNVLMNLTAVLRWARITEADIGLNWMPLTHDMGLIGTHIKGLLAGIDQYNMSTTLFIKRPTLWLEKASQHRATLLYSPNFGYKHFLKFFAANTRREWDLSSVRLIYNGAEPISLELCREFLETMAPYGLKANAMYPVYGLAEGTIAVTFPEPGSDVVSIHLDRKFLGIGDPIRETAPDDDGGITFVEVGAPIEYCELRICDETDLDLGEDRIGYIEIRGGNVTSGYYHNPQATAAAVKVGGWLNTGDLGFLRRGKLYVTGRAKDIIFMAGQNYYSHDVERVTEDLEGLELGKVAAVGVFNEERRCDELVLFVLFKQKVAKFLPLLLEVKSVVNRRLGIEVAEVIPVKSIPKTTSGKIQRFQLREQFISGAFNDLLAEIHQLLQNETGRRTIEPLETPGEVKLAELWSEVLGHPGALGRADNFFVLGGDSLRATQLLSRIQDIFGVKLEQEALFEYPELGKLAALIDEGRPNPQDALDSIKRYTGNEGSFPLSYAQQRLWFMDRLYHGSPQYNLASALRLKGTLNSTILTRSIREIFTRHAILRTAFREEAGVPRQIVQPEAFPMIETVTLLNLPEAERTPKALALAQEMAARSFKLEEAPLFRAQLYQVDATEHILALAAHHLIFDGWSFGVFLHELAFLYTKYSKAEGPETGGLPEPARLPELAIQYYDYCGWQMERFANQQLKAQLDYWKTQLSRNLPALHLPLDKPRPALQTFGGAKIIQSLPGKLVSDLQRIARERGATLFMILLAAFDTLLYRYTGQEEIVVGTTVANRNYRALEPLIGFFTNNLVLRAAIPENTGFLEFLAGVKQVTLGAYANQDLPFEKIVEEIHPERDLSQNPLFQVLFSLQNTPGQPAGFAGIEIDTLELNNDFSRFDLAVDLWETKQGLAAVFEYNTALFLPETIVRMAGHYMQLLEGIAANPTLELNQYPILTPEERRTLLQEWNDTRIDFQSELWVKIFEENAANAPDTIALVAGEQRLTYGELNRRANQLAHYIQAQGVKPEVVTGVYLERTAMMLVALLGIHKAGGAYLPLDPIFPKQRIEYMLENAQVPLVLTQSSLLSTLPETSAQIICLDTSGKALEVQSPAPPGHSASSASLAYLIYTSGSTGKPKGVQIEHGALANFLQGMKLQIDIGPGDRLLAVTTLSFDIAGLELFLPLIAGATVVMADREEVISGARLLRKLDEHDITLMQATPATWRMLLDAGWQGKNNLKILCGGEAVPRDLGAELLKRAARVWNVYGPTETTIWSTIAELKLPLETVSIGRPIANTQIYIVDLAFGLVPMGIPGELLIGGAGLARGYLKLPELTAEKFVPNNLMERAPQGAPLQKIYRTGDLARWLPDGTIECLGRIDHQVKIRGYRIELGEIEGVLNQHPKVEASVVVAKELRPGEKSLVGYFTSNADPGADSNYKELRDFLKEKLPDYMVPAAFVQLTAFPLTPNGKIDRLALPMPARTGAEQIRTTGKEAQIPPANEIEGAIARIWREVLNMDRIGVHDSFFDLGGHSLLLGQVQSKLQSILNFDIEMLELFKYPTIRMLADYIRRQLQGAAEGDPQIKIGVQRVKGDHPNLRMSAIAIVGLSGRFPGARNTTEFWRNLCDGVEAITRFSDEELLAAGVAPDLLNQPQFVKAWGALAGIEKFDAAFFGYNPNEAVILDPQQRIFLEETWHALENAGYDSEQFAGRIGVFAGMGMNTYQKNLQDNTGELASDYQVMISNDKDFLATRVAYKLNLEGPGLTVQTACSTSLVAVHLACQSL
ncbi:MAG TPA: amino acid adenylation domain-containing protein, partial [Bacillota bacterium]|nr:amino acid adenylation domain-containing protein [Bacillota bacterium]